MVLSIMVPQFPAIGSGGVPSVPPTILMSDVLLNHQLQTFFKVNFDGLLTHV
jgi:hypothetical protein